MSILQVSEKIIRKKFITLEEKTGKTINHNESELFYKDDLIYKIIKEKYRYERLKNMHAIENNKFSFGNNIENTLYQGDKFIGVTSKYLENLETLKTYKNKIDLYELKIIMNYIIKFYEETLENNLIYWDNHMNNFGISNNNFYILDIDSMKYTEKDIDKSFALNGLFTLFFELYYKTSIRNNYCNYSGVISLISECENYINYKLTLEEIKNIIKDISEDYLESKRKILNMKKI